MQTGPGPYGSFQQAPQVQPSPPLRLRTSPLAIASLVVSLAFCCIGINGVAAIVLGALALRQLRNRPDEITGRGLAQAGISLGVLSVLLALGFWGFMLFRYFELKPIAREVTVLIQQNDLDEAQTYFARSVRDDPHFNQDLVETREYLNRRGPLRELGSGYSIRVSGGVTTVIFNGHFERGTMRMTCLFIKEEGHWRLLGYTVN